MSLARLSPNRDRVMENLNELAKYGAVGSGAITRLAFTREDLAAREYVESLMREAGLETSHDSFGNIFGKRPGRRNVPSVMTGSHIDGPPKGGIYDGTVGVIGGIECMRLFNELGLQTELPVEVVVFACEHLDRFGVGCLGSRALVGKLASSDLESLTDPDGITLWEALQKAGLEPQNLGNAQRSHEELRAFVELHIEQGPVLDKLKKKIGIVTDIAGPTRMEIRILGETNHSGGTPMSMRRDALAAASEVVLAVESCAQAEQDCGTVGTVGVLDVEPGSMVAIPGRACMLVDIRGVRWESKQRAVSCTRERIDRIAKRRGVRIETTTSVDEKPVSCSSEIVSALDLVTRGMNIEGYHMPSGGGHDAQHMADVTESGMIFVPSVEGVSHAPAEYTDLDDICLGISVLAHGLYHLSSHDTSF